MNNFFKISVILVVMMQTVIVFGQNTATTQKSLKQIYKKAEKQFSAFEKKHGNFIDTKNVKMHYLAWGIPSNPSLIWIHGSMNNAYELHEIGDSLAKSGFYIIAIDYYGHGQTPIPSHEVSIYHIADDIKVLMDHLSIDKAFVGGFSRGGYIATAFYDSYPEKVLGLVLEDGGSVAANTYFHKLNQKELDAKAKLFDDETQKPWDLTYRTKFEAFESLYDKNESANQFTILALIRENGVGEWRIIYSEMMKLFHWENSQQFLDLTLRPTKVPLFARSMMMIEPEIVYRNLNVPILILDPISENDPMPFEQENIRLRNMHQNKITYIAYPETEHNIHYAHPQKFVEDVSLFLKKCVISGAK